MIPDSVVHACSSLLAILAAPAIRSLSLACLAALALGTLRVKSVATRLAVWTAVLYAALAMPLLGVMLPSISLKVPPEAAKFISQRLKATIVPLSDEKISEVRVTPPAPVAAMSEVDPASQSSPISLKHYLTRNRDLASSHAAPVIADRSSIAGLPSFAYSRSAIVPVAPARRAAARVPWAAIAAAIYFAVAVLFLGRLILGFFFSRRLVRSANPITAWEATCPLAIQARDAGLMVIPELAESAAISVPVTMGILRPVILFPIEWREWDLAALHAVIAHELSHVIRRDALTQRLSLLHRAAFWFSPLSWWLHRCLADAAEEASDEAALVSGADRARYAETLLGFFAALQESPRRVYWHGVSMAKAGQAEKRVDRILAWKGDVGMRTNKFAAIAMILAGVPAVIFTAAARPSLHDTSIVDTQAAGSQATQQAANSTPDPAPRPTPTSPVPKALRAPQAPAAPKAGSPSVSPAPPVVPSAPAPTVLPREPLPPIPPAPAAAPTPMPRVQVTFDGSINKERLMELQAEIKQWTMDNKDKLKDEMSAEITKIIESQLKDLRVNPKIQVDVSKVPQTDPLVRVKMRTDGFSDRYVVVSGDSPIFMSGDSQDVEHATALRGKINGDFIWFQRDEKSYVIRDQATVNRAKEFFKPQQQLGEKQQALGKQQQALGDQQRDLGKKMQTVQIQLPDMSADMQKLEAEMKQLSAGATQQQVGDLQRQIGELQRRIGQSQSQVGDQMRKDSEPMRALGDQQRDLGRQQRELGQQQRDASRQARDQMKQLLDDAVTKGTAQPE